MGVPSRDIRLATERLVLRPSTLADAARAVEIQSDWQVTRMLRMAAFPPDLADTEAWFAGHEREWRAGFAYRFAVEEAGAMIGLVDVDGIAAGSGVLGYWFERAAWGRGYAFEAASRVVAFALGEAGLTRLTSGHAADNPASGRVLIKLGFRQVDEVELISRSRGEPIRQIRYALPPRGEGSLTAPT